MTAVQFLFPENRLAKLIRRPGGVSYAQAMAAAEANMDSIRADVLAGVDENLQRIDQLSADPAVAFSPEIQAELYERSNYVAGLAGSGGLPELGQAAFCYCELLDRIIAGAAWPQAAVTVHMDSLKLLRAMGVASPENDRAAIVEGLRKVAERVIRPAAE